MIELANDLNSAANPPAQYGPAILWVLGLAAPFLITFCIWLTVTNFKHTTLLAVIAEHLSNNDKDILDSKKAHDEIIDLKLASAELNQHRINDRADIDLLLKDREVEITENRKRK